MSEQEDDNYSELDTPKPRFDTARWNSLTDTDDRPARPEEQEAWNDYWEEREQFEESANDIEDDE